MRGRRSVVALLLLLIVLLGCTACGREEMGAEEALAELMEREELPSGECYRAAAEEGQTGYLSRDTRDALYGADSGELFGTVADYAIYLSAFPVPCEIALFRCHSATDADRIAAMCLERIDLLTVALRGTPHGEIPQKAKLIRRGRWVVMLMTEEPRRLETEALRLIR